MYSSSITVDEVIDALAAFITPFVGSSEIVRAQVNRVAMPQNPCILLTELLTTDLSVPDTEYDPDNSAANITGPKRIDVQIDFYDGNSGEYCSTIKTAMRSHWAYSHFPANIKPLYTSDGIQAPLVTGEQQYESRWTLTASLQYNPVVTVPQDFANTLTANVFPPADE